MEQAKLLNIKKISQKLQQIEQNLTLMSIYTSYKIFSKNLIYYMKNYNEFIRECKQIKNNFQSCLMIIKMFVNSSEYVRFGHWFPLYKYIVQYYEKQYSIEIKDNLKNNSHRSQILQKQTQLIHPNIEIIKLYEQKPYKKIQLNQTIVSISKQQILLHNSQCVCCSKVFIKNMNISNQNPYFPNLYCMNQKQNSYFNLQRYICSICNIGGGVLIIGAQKKNNNIQAIGIRFKDNDQVRDYIAQINRNISFINPRVQATVEKVLVHTNFIQKDEIKSQYLRYCFRISVFPTKIENKHYIQIKNKGYHLIYETFQFNKYKKPQKIQAEQFSDGTIINLYTLIHDYYKINAKNKKHNIIKTNIHKNIKCYQPYTKNSKLFNTYSQNNQKQEIKNTQKKQQDNKNTQKIQNQILNDQPKYKYNYTCLLTVGAKSKDKFVKEFSNCLKSKKMLHQIQKPFANSFKDGSKSNWLLSHNDHVSSIKNILKQFDKSRIITLIPVYRTLQADRLKFTKQKQQNFQQKFYSRYPQGYFLQQMQTEVGQNQLIKNPVFLTFDSFNQSIFGYLILQSLQVRSFFVKQNTTYKKKATVSFDYENQENR